MEKILEKCSGFIIRLPWIIIGEIEKNKFPRPTTPPADFSCAVRQPHDYLNLRYETRMRPPGVSSATFTASPPNLQRRLLLDMDFAIQRTPPRDDALANYLHFASNRLSRGIFTPKPPTMPGARWKTSAPTRLFYSNSICIAQL